MYPQSQPKSSWLALSQKAVTHVVMMSEPVNNSVKAVPRLRHRDPDSREDDRPTCPVWPILNINLNRISDGKCNEGKTIGRFDSWEANRFCTSYCLFTIDRY